MWMFCTRSMNTKRPAAISIFLSEERPKIGGGGGVYGADRLNASDPPP